VKITKFCESEADALLNTTANAVDSRNRRTEERRLQHELLSRIPDDILEAVDVAGGVTPAGRVAKAVLLWLERVGM
jgi:hypothetical protein